MGVGDAQVANVRGLILRPEDVIRATEMFSVGDLPLGQGQACVQSCIYDNNRPH